MTPEQLAAMERVLADLNKHYPYEDESGIIKLSLGRFMNARETIRTAIEQAKRQQALDKMAENERELGIQMQPEPVDFFDWYDNAIWGNEDFKAGCQRAWDAALEYAAPAAPVQESDDLTIAYMAGYGKGKAAAQRQWVGLTDEEIEKLAVENGHATFLNDDEETGIIWFDGDATPFARAIEQKLREKNGG